MFKFEVGSVYYARSACNHDCVFLMKVLSRTFIWKSCTSRTPS